MRPKSTTLTAHELELMKIVWQHEDGVTVRDVYEELRTHRVVAYTTLFRSPARAAGEARLPPRPTAG